MSRRCWLASHCSFNSVLMGFERRSMGSFRVTRASAFLEAMSPFQLPGTVEHYLDAIRALVVDASSAHCLRELVQHRPRHARQVAQVAVLPLLHHRHLAAGMGAVGERSAFFGPLENFHKFNVLGRRNTVTILHLRTLRSFNHIRLRGRRVLEVRDFKWHCSVSGSRRD